MMPPPPGAPSQSPINDYINTSSAMMPKGGVSIPDGIDIDPATTGPDMAMRGSPQSDAKFSEDMSLYDSNLGKMAAGRKSLLDAIHGSKMGDPHQKALDNYNIARANVNELNDPPAHHTPNWADTLPSASTVSGHAQQAYQALSEPAKQIVEAIMSRMNPPTSNAAPKPIQGRK
jgi:hypothetical protein